MGSYEDCCFTIRPTAPASVDDVADEVDAFLNRSFEELPDLPDEITEYARHDSYYERDRLSVDVDETRGQVYVGGRTHSTSSRDAWSYWLRDLGIGDGHLAYLWYHEADLRGYAKLWRWDDTGEAYVTATVPDMEAEEGPETLYAGEEFAKSARIAQEIAATSTVQPARHDKGTFYAPGDDGFPPRHYLEVKGEL